MWISPAYAQSGGDGGGLMTFLPLILIFVVFYFLLIRPQQKKAKEHRAMVDNVRRGDDVVTGGGIMGKVTKVKDDNTIQIEVAEGVRINVVKGTLSDVRSKSAPAANDTTPAGKSDGESGGIMGKLGLKK
ncbi:preprotein translocase subunit YajC [Minwuia sp.]|uniref:preprotein translocase subunit YajC n=1 Tax=Minwuia sp. TaxID=2493630 RepID=UPI003A90DF0C